MINWLSSKIHVAAANETTDGLFPRGEAKTQPVQDVDRIRDSSDREARQCVPRDVRPMGMD